MGIVLRSFWYRTQQRERERKKNRYINRTMRDDEDHSSRRGEDGVNIIQILLGITMLAIGSQHTHDCPNGAAQYLVAAGGIILVSNFVRLVIVCVHTCAGDRINCVESCGLCLFKLAGCLLAMLAFIVLIWGSVVVFGAYSTWTYEDSDPLNQNYCQYNAFMAAFVILIVNWILMPFIIMCNCLTALCNLCCRGS